MKKTFAEQEKRPATRPFAPVNDANSDAAWASLRKTLSVDKAPPPCLDGAIAMAARRELARRAARRRLWMWGRRSLAAAAGLALCAAAIAFYRRAETTSQGPRAVPTTMAAAELAWDNKEMSSLARPLAMDLALSLASFSAVNDDGFGSEKDWAFELDIPDFLENKANFWQESSS